MRLFLLVVLLFIIHCYEAKTQERPNRSFTSFFPKRQSTSEAKNFTSALTSSFPLTSLTSSSLPTEERDSRFFMFGINKIFGFLIRVKNDSCNSTTGDRGTCYKESDCTQLKGTASGTCGNGFGTCCIFTRTCGDTTSENCTYFISRGYPTAFDTVGSCQLVVNKVNENVCQLRLDFVEFVIAGPSAQTICENDRFTVSGSSSIPVICGTNTGNHMYISLGSGATGPTTLSFITMGPSFSRKWKVKVTQIPCNDANAAPTGCLQHFTGITGQIQTYNYNAAMGLQLANQDYTSCIRTERSFCGIQYTPCDNTTADATVPQSFTLSGTSASGSLVGTTGQCTTDWVVIPCSLGSATQAVSECVDRFCGRLLNFGTRQQSTAGNAPIFSTVKPFRINYHTDTSEVTGETNNRGYCLNYVQQPCT